MDLLLASSLLKLKLKRVHGRPLPRLELGLRPMGHSRGVVPRLPRRRPT